MIYIYISIYIYIKGYKCILILKKAVYIYICTYKTKNISLLIRSFVDVKKHHWIVASEKNELSVLLLLKKLCVFNMYIIRLRGHREITCYA